MKKKALSGVKITNEDEGRVQAVFATLNKIDSDGDVTRPGAFEDGAEVRISAYNHQSWQGALPVGKGVIHERDEEAILDGQFFMDNPDAKATFNVIKGMGDLQEWSYGYDVLERAEGKWPEDDPEGKDVQFLDSLKVHEASPVILGAGVATRTLAVKGAKDIEKTLENLPHHKEESGTADPQACKYIIAILNGGNGGVLVSDEKREGIYEHVAQHLREAGQEPPELLSGDPGKTKLADRLAWLEAELSQVNKRVADVMAKRAEKGKSLGEDAYEGFAKLESTIGSMRAYFAVGTDEDIARRRALARHARASLLATREEDLT